MKKEFTRRAFLKGAAAGTALFGFGTFGQLTGAKAQAAEDGQDLYILYTNDVHCAIDSNIGYLGLAEMKSALKAAGKEVLLVDSGDFIQGGLAGTLSHGTYLVDIMNMAGYDAAALGNHEFDFGMENLLSLHENMKFPLVCCNFLDADGLPVFDPYVIIEAAGKKIALIGAVTPTTITSSTPKYFQDDAGNYIYDFCYDTTCDRLAQAVQSAIDDAKAEGADECILLSHMGVIPEGTSSSIYGQLQSTTLISKTRGLSLVLDGHSHTVLPEQTVEDADGNPVVLTQTGTQLIYVGLAILGADGSVHTQLLDDAGMKSFIEEINAEMNEYLETPIAECDFPLYISEPSDPTLRLVRKQETNLADFCADALRYTCGTEIGLVNGGGVRCDLAAGTLSYGDLINVFPFSNLVCIRKVTGAQLLDALEQGVSQYPNEFGGFLQVSGLTFTVDATIPSGVKTDENAMFVSVEGDRRVKDVMVNGEPLDEAREYTVASTDYILTNHGNGYTMFDGDEYILESGPVDNEALCTYAQDVLSGTIPAEYEDPYGDGRITILT